MYAHAMNGYGCHVLRWLLDASPYVQLRLLDESGVRCFRCARQPNSWCLGTHISSRCRRYSYVLPLLCDAIEGCFL